MADKRRWKGKLFPLCEVFGVSSPTLVLLSYWLRHPSKEFTKTELSRRSNISRKTIYKVLTLLLEFEIIVENNRIDPYTFYKLNTNSEITKHLLKFNRAIIKFKKERDVAGQAKDTAETLDQDLEAGQEPEDQVKPAAIDDLEVRPVVPEPTPLRRPHHVKGGDRH